MKNSVLISSMELVLLRKRGISFYIGVLIPALFAICFCYIYSYGVNQDKQYQFHIYSSEEIAEKIEEKYPQINAVYHKNKEYSKSEKTGKKIVFYISDTVELIYDSSTLMNEESLYEAEELAYQFNLLCFNELLYSKYDLSSEYSIHDVCTQREYVETKLSLLVGFLVFGIIIGSDFGIKNYVDELFFESRNKGTLDIYRLTGIGSKAIFVGKIVPATFFMLVSRVSAFLGSILGVSLFCEEESNLFLLYSKNYLLCFLVLLICILQVGIINVIIYAFFAISYNGDSRSGDFSIILSFFFSLLPVLSIIFKTEIFNLFPFLNLFGVAVDLFVGKINVQGLVVSSIITLAIVFCFGIVSINKVERD